MFDFLDSDWFNITLEIIFLILVIYDIKHYIQTKKQEYLLNIVLTIGFAIWTLLPYYHKYITWDEQVKQKVTKTFIQDYNQTLGRCMSDELFKEYSYEDYVALDKNSTKYQSFLKEEKEDCLDDSWF
ncbi:hypothetical protein MNB_SM-3-577 [hydrothermal vent metagenome]|uniref:Uncharacterized protein n=1 Tax=hydrothermal vent metagenome TaxID=652676 RepID=A0A1W1D2Q5_9ZZZZ